jgi:hypothetical protein
MFVLMNFADHARIDRKANRDCLAGQVRSGRQRRVLQPNKCRIDATLECIALHLGVSIGQIGLTEITDVGAQIGCQLDEVTRFHLYYL